MKSRKQRGYQAIQLELFEVNEVRNVSDRELIGNLTTKVDEVCGVWESTYHMENLFNQLSPKTRRIAISAVELYRRRECVKRNRVAITESVDTFRLMKPLIAHLPSEEFWLIALSTHNRVIGRQRVSMGGQDQTLADVRIIMRKAIAMEAASIIVVHNHPSGNERPSQADRLITERLKEAGKIMAIHLMDHVIVTEWSYYSFHDEGLI